MPRRMKYILNKDSADGSGSTAERVVKMGGEKLLLTWAWKNVGDRDARRRQAVCQASGTE